MSGAAAVLHDLKVATIFLTRLPVRLEGPLAMRDLAAAVYAFPLVGALVGLLGGVGFWVAHRLGLPATVCAVAAVAAMVLATGALHEDGLADTADGLGASRERALEIMRDSRIGTYGTLALVLALLTRVAALGALDGPGRVAAALIAAGAGSRAVLPVVMLLQPSARAGGLMAEAGRPQPERVISGAVLAAAGAFLLLPLEVAASALLAAALGGWIVAGWLGQRLGGCTGDTLGAVQQLAELSFLLAVLARA